jgi:hypothetical protein
MVVGTVPAAAQNRVGASTSVMINTVGPSTDIGAGQRPGKTVPQSGIVVATGVAADAGDAGGGLRIGYHATHPEFAAAIRSEGFRLSEGGRLGGGGVYVSDTPETAIAEFAAHNPGIEPEVLRVQYDPGHEFIFNEAPQVPYLKGIMPPEWADSLTAPSVQEGGWNTLIRNGTQAVL